MGDLNSRRLRTDPAGVYVGLSGRTLEKKRVDGSGPRFIKLGRCVVYDVRGLDLWLAAGRRISTSDPGPELHPAA